jgi:formylglycine-generating enzyme required for sulfatase activity
MKNWMKASVLAMVLALGSAQAAVVSLGSYVEIGDPNNTGDGVFTKYGAVDHVFEIGTHEITYGQWTAFRNARPDVPNTGGTAENHWVVNYGGDDNYPVVNVSLVEATLYANWLTSGDPNDGVYYYIAGDPFVSPYTAYPQADRELALKTWGTIHVLPTENEWYKAAYYEGGNRWSDYSDGSDDTTTSEEPIEKWSRGDSPEHGWNYESEYMRTALAGALEQNGTINLNGNVFEWMEELTPAGNGIVRGGTGLKDYSYMRSGSRDTHFMPWESDYDVGFRMAKVIPEPMTVGLALIGGCVAWFARLKQRL